MSYYTGDTIPLKFTITDATGAVNPSAVAVEILKPHNTLITGATAGIDGNVVTYNVPASVTNEHGNYKAYFICTLSFGERTHKMEFTIILNPEENK